MPVSHFFLGILVFRLEGQICPPPLGRVRKNLIRIRKQKLETRFSDTKWEKSPSGKKRDGWFLVKPLEHWPTGTLTTHANFQFLLPLTLNSSLPPLLTFKPDSVLKKKSSNSVMLVVLGSSNYGPSTILGPFTGKLTYHLIHTKQIFSQDLSFKE